MLTFSMSWDIGIEKSDSYSSLPNRKLLKAIVAHYLGAASTDVCQVTDVDEWIHGSFNVCIRVDVSGQEGNFAKQLTIRFPLLYRISEDCCLGNTDKNFRCEAGIYV